MQDLPPGWSVSNSSGNWAAPHRLRDDAVDEDEMSENEDLLPDSPGWEDAEEDVEQVAFECLRCPNHFPAAVTMLEHCKEAHDFDLLSLIKKHHLDFFGTIKLVNFVRDKTTRQDVTETDYRDPFLWSDDRYLKPVLQDDALLFSLDDLAEFTDSASNEANDEDGDSHLRAS